MNLTAQQLEQFHRDGYLVFQRGIARRERFDGGDPT